MRMKQEMLDQSTDRKGKGRDKGQPSSHHFRCNLLLKLVSILYTFNLGYDEHNSKFLGNFFLNRKQKQKNY